MLTQVESAIMPPIVNAQGKVFLVACGLVA
jgi:hypothetical protein